MEREELGTESSRSRSDFQEDIGWSRVYEPSPRATAAAVHSINKDRGPCNGGVSTDL